MASIIVFRGKNFSVARALAIQIGFLFDDHAKRIAVTGIGVEIEIPAKNLREGDCKFRRFAGIFNRAEKRTVYGADDGARFHVRNDRLNFRVETGIARLNKKQTVRIDLVADGAKHSGDGAADGENISRMKMASIENRRNGSGDRGGCDRVEAERLQG